MRERLQKLIARAGVCSRRTAETLLTAGRVTVNGVAAHLGDKADADTDVIAIDGTAVTFAEPSIYLMLNKPRGYVTTLRDELGRATAAELVADCGVRVFPVGRLDKDSEGLLLFTNDGALMQAMNHPSHQVDKTYLVWVTGFVPGKETQLETPIVLDGYRIRRPRVKLLDARERKARLEITIHEGRNRQIRRMCEAAGMEVTRLKRIREGSLSLGNLPVGAWRYLTPEEIKKLRHREDGFAAP